MLLDELPEDSSARRRLPTAWRPSPGWWTLSSPLRAQRLLPGGPELLRPLMACENGPTMPRMWAVGNAHLDLAWLWPQRETHRKTARTFAAQLRLLERYPEYRFLQSQPAAYEMCREYYPSLYEKIRRAAAEGRWIAEGAMYVEPDTNMPSGEALIRQLVFGKRFFKEELGWTAACCGCRIPSGTPPRCPSCSRAAA